MSFELTSTAQALALQTSKEPQIILEIQGIDLIFGAITVQKLAEYGDNINYGDSGLVYGGAIDDENSREWISLQGTTTNFSQQVEIDKASALSVQRVNINLIDKDQNLTELFSPGQTIVDLMGNRATVYLNFGGGAHPEDSIRVMSGRVADMDAKAGSFSLVIAHPEDDKRQDLFPLIQTNTVGAITDLDTTVTLESANGIIANDTYITTYFQIEDEIVKVTDLTGTLATIERAQFGTIAEAHDDDTELETRYEFSGNTIDLALTMMLSGTSNDIEDIVGENFVQIDSLLSVDNGILIPERNLADKYGLVEGDLFTSTGAANAANNVSLKSIISFTDHPNGTILVIDDVSFVAEQSANASVSFRSQYNLWPNGAGMNMSTDQVDVAQHLAIFNNIGVSFPDTTFFLKDTVKGKEFIPEQLYFPFGMYATPRKGRTSCNITLPSFSNEGIKTFSADNIKNPDKIVVKRSTNKYFYNTVTYRFNPDQVEDKFLGGEINVSQTSLNRIKIGSKSLTIDSDGMRDDQDTRTYIETQARRFTDRYQFGAEVFEFSVLYGDGFNSEVGDAIILNADGLNIYDSITASRQFAPRVLEIINKSMDIKTGDIKFICLDTSYSLEARYATIGPSSKIDAGSTLTTLVLKDSFGNVGSERDKWSGFLNEDIRVISSDFTYDETTTFLGFSPSNPNAIIVSALPSLPSEDFVIELRKYDNGSDATLNGNQKALHAYMNPQLEIDSGVSESSFNLVAGDELLLIKGQPVRVHNEDYSTDSNPNQSDEDVIVVDVSGSLVTLSRDIGFIPSNGDKVDLVGFLDGGKPYRLV